MYKKTTLNNGLRIVSHTMPGRQSMALGIWITIGGRYETNAQKGISHFIEHMLFKGSRHFSCRRLKESIEGVGGSLNGFTSEELTCYLAKMPATHSGVALEILSDMVLYPAFPHEEVEKEKTVILEEIKMYRDLPQSYVYELLDELLWPKQPLGTPIIGSAQSVGALQRNDLVSFKKNHYTPSNIIVSASGAVEHSRLVEGLQRIFGRSPAGKRNSFLPVQEQQSEPQLHAFHKETEQTHMALGFHSFSRHHPLRHALGLLHVVLGANMSSRLFNEVREKRGLAYEIGTQVKRYRDTGAFIVHAGIDNRKVSDALSLILKELARTKHALISRDEFNRARQFYKGQLMLALEDTLDHMLWIGETTAVMDKTYSLKDIIAEVDRISRKDVQEAARQTLIQKNMNLALIGPLKSGKQNLSRRLVID